MSQISTSDDIPTQKGRYKSSITNILSKHCAEIKLVSDDIVNPMISTTKKKLKELITKHNNEIFSFITNPNRSPQLIESAETIIKKYEHEIPTISGETATQILRDLNLNLDMSSATDFFDTGLKKLKGDTDLNSFIAQNRWIFNQYKILGEEVLRLETNLFQQIETLDKLYNRTQLITSLTTNDVLPELINTFSKYADNIYKSTDIETTYKELVETYKKWNICRQIISTHNAFKNESNPSCAICLNDPITSAIVPCGHTFCSMCIKKQNTTCYICRGTIRERIKLYFT